MAEESDVTTWYDDEERKLDDKVIPEGKEPQVFDNKHGLNQPREEYGQIEES